MGCARIAQNGQQPVFLLQTSTSLLKWRNTSEFKKTTQSEQSPNRPKIAESGHTDHESKNLVTLILNKRTKTMSRANMLKRLLTCVSFVENTFLY
jgi:hypothetical protein